MIGALAAIWYAVGQLAVGELPLRHALRAVADDRRSTTSLSGIALRRLLPPRAAALVKNLLFIGVAAAVFTTAAAVIAGPPRTGASISRSGIEALPDPGRRPTSGSPSGAREWRRAAVRHARRLMPRAVPASGGSATSLDHRSCAYRVRRRRRGRSVDGRGAAARRAVPTPGGWRRGRRRALPTLLGASRRPSSARDRSGVGTTPRGSPFRRALTRASLSATMANAQTQTTPQRLAAIREQMSLLADYL